MNMPYITALYTGATALFLVVLSLRISLMRMKMGAIECDDALQKNLATAIRTQANLTEYAPIAMLILLLGEMLLAPGWVLHVLGGMFLAGRILHLYGFSSQPQKIPLRKAGMVLTYAMLMFGGLLLIGFALF